MFTFYVRKLLGRCSLTSRQCWMYRKKWRVCSITGFPPDSLPVCPIDVKRYVLPERTYGRCHLLNWKKAGLSRIRAYDEKGKKFKVKTPTYYIQVIRGFKFKTLNRIFSR